MRHSCLTSADRGLASVRTMMVMSASNLHIVTACAPMGRRSIRLRSGKQRSLCAVLGRGKVRSLRNHTETVVLATSAAYGRLFATQAIAWSDGPTASANVAMRCVTTLAHRSTMIVMRVHTGAVT